MNKKAKDKEIEPGYNGWLVLVIVICIIGSEDWILLGSILITIVYVSWIEYLRIKVKLKLREIR